jgi:signal transduction histidine kinase
MRTDFVAITSHELRTPLTAISGFVRTMRRTDLDLTDSARAEFLEVMDRQTQRLTSIVEDLHFLAEVEAGRLPLRLGSVDLPALAAEVLADDFPGQAGRIELSGAPSLVLVSDADRLRRVISALVDNAVKFSSAPVEVAVLQHGGGAVVEVRDRGPGIAPEETERIFDPFHQVGGAMKRRQEGVGLGLYVARRLVEAMGGTLGVRSTPGEGSVFSVSLSMDPEGYTGSLRDDTDG